jgi:SGNH domain (fused to AT3 domains)
MRTRRMSVVAAVLVAASLTASAAFAIAKLPAPGTAAKVASLVAASSKIQKLPKVLIPALDKVANDSPATYYKVTGRCSGPPACVYGATASKTTIVLFGDSHAMMWLPALVPVAKKANDRLLLLWKPGCPDTTITVWDPLTHSTATGCDSYRAAMIAEIKRLAPKLVLLSDRTSDIPGAGNVLTTDAAWQAGLVTTISKLKSSKTKVAVVGDITAFTVILPDCLAAFPNAVQKCAAPNPNPKTRQHFAAERAAAASQGVPYVDPQGWLCTKTCSPVIGNMVGYFDNLHVTATYAAFLATVFGTALKPLLAK